MSHRLNFRAMEKQIESFFLEDDLSRNAFYNSSLPETEVNCSLYLKDDLILSGLPWLLSTFNYLGAELSWDSFSEYEGKHFSKKEKRAISFKLPFSIALTGERIALNLVQRSSSISTFTNKFVKKAELAKTGVKILDTRKTTPGLRSLEKYAVRLGGGFNHRLGQTDMWMIKDNHKKFFGGVQEAHSFFKNMQGFYTPIELEVHDLKELNKAFELNIKHVMLDNFSPADIQKAISVKPENVTYEVSGGINLESIESYLIKGVDAISVGRMTYGAPPVDISLKYEKA